MARVEARMMEFEIDLLVERPGNLCALEIKSSATFSKDFLKQLDQWRTLDPSVANSERCVVYSGLEAMTVQDKNIISYRDIGQCFP